MLQKVPQYVRVSLSRLVLILRAKTTIMASKHALMKDLPSLYPSTLLERLP